MEKSYQTIIIGMGVGGLNAARYLKDALILDQKLEIGETVRTGEGISRQALEKIGIDPDPSFISCKIDLVQRIAPNGKAFGRRKKEIGYILNKPAFEKFLANQSLAEIRLNCRVVDIKRENDFWVLKTADNHAFKAKHLIGADGVGSVVRRKIFKEELKIFPAVQYLVELERKIDTTVARIYLDNEKFTNGYTWIFPKSENTANIGIVGTSKDLTEKLNRFLGEVVKKEFGEYQILENRSGVIPIGVNNIRIFKDSAFLIGDAAGLADPIFLGGMSQALLSGKISAECILNNGVEMYEERIKSLPFSNPRLIGAREIIYSFNNQILNELGDVLEGKGTSYLKTIPGFVDFLRKPRLRKNIFKILYFFSLWWKNRDYLW